MLILHRRCVFAFVLIVGLLTGGLHVAAQTTAGAILGTVTDSSGAAVPDALVRLTNTGTGVTQIAMSDGEGRYRVPALPVGGYEVQVEKEGFQTVDRKGITLTVGGEAVVDFSLPVGQVTQTVTIQSEVPQVETTSSEISSLVSEAQMRELPLNGRDVDQLILLAPGVTVMQAIGYSSTNGMGNSFSVSGSRTRGQWEILDDNDVMSWQDRNSGSGVLGTSLGVDAIAEFQVLTNTYSAQYGGNGAVVNSVTKSGTNDLHGSAYEFLRNSALDARNFFDPPQKPEFQKNQFGGTLGGPIKKEKMFFFGNYEGLRQISNPPYAFNLPDAAVHQGYVNQVCVNNKTIVYPNPSCAATIPAAVQKFLSYFPDPTLFTHGTDNSGEVTAYETMKSPGSENYVVGRWDWTISSKDSMFARYLYDEGNLFDVTSATPSSTAPTGWSTQDNTKNQFLSIEEKRSWSSNVISSTRIGFSRTFLSTFTPANENYQNGLWNWLGTSDTFGFAAPPIGAISITQLLNSNFPRSILGGGAGTKIIQNKFSGGEDVYWNKGAHALRFGGVITRVQSYIFAPPTAGTWSFTNLTNFLTQIPSNYTGTCLATVFVTCANAGFSTAQVSPHQFLQSDFGFYIQDDWKVRNTVTVNLGLRYSPETNPIDAFGTMQAALNLPLSASYNPALPMPGCTAPAPSSCPMALPSGVTGYTAIHNVYLTNPSFHNFDPRVGIAWDPFKDHKTSIRAGYGIFHSPITPYDYTSGFSSAPAGTTVTQQCGATGASCSTFPTPFQTAGTFSPSLAGGIDNGDKQTPYMQQYNLTVQREITKGTVASLGYVGSHGVHLIGLTDENPPLPTGVPGAVTVGAGKVAEYYGPIGPFLTAGTPSSPQSANGQAIVDSTTGQMSYANVICTAGTPPTNCSVVANNRIDPALSFWDVSRTTFWSRYNSLQASLTRRISSNAQAQLSYTYASCTTNSSGSTGLEGQIVGEDAYNTNLDRGPCVYMIRHNFYMNGLYVLPFNKGRLLSGWQLSGIFQYHTGTPVFVGTGWFSGIIDRSGNAVNSRPNLVPGCTQVIATLAHWINPACYAQPPIGEPGNVGMNSIFGPDSMTLDPSLVKNTRISERYNLQFRVEVFNVFNRANFRNAGQPAIPVFSQVSPLPPSCGSTPSTCSVVNGNNGQTTLTNTTARQIQLAMKFIF